MRNLPGFVVFVVRKSNDNSTLLFGSPADRAGLSIGDEIIEVNGVAVESSSHAEIVRHIHQCIKSRTIQLRVRRKTDQNIAQAITRGEAEVTDAYLVSVDQQQKSTVEKRLKQCYTSVRTHDMEAVHERLQTGRDPLTGQSLVNGHVIQHHVTNANVDRQAIVNNQPIVNGGKPVDNVTDTDVNGTSSVSQSVPRSTTFDPVHLVQQSSVIETKTTTTTTNKIQNTTTNQKTNEVQQSSIIMGPDLEINETDYLDSLPPPPPPEPQQKSIPINTNGTSEHSNDRLIDYEHNLQKREQSRLQFQRQQEFLRTSLRNSKKLQSLQNTQQREKIADSFVNAGYDLPEPSHEHDQIELNEIMAAADRVTQGLNDRPEEAKVINDLFSQKQVQSAIDVSAVVHRKWQSINDHQQSDQSARSSSPDTNNVQSLLSARAHVDGVLRQVGEALSESAAELQTILETNHMAALINAHDRIVDSMHAQMPSTSSADNQAPLGSKETAFISGPMEFQGNLRIVRLFKPQDSYLGATVRSVEPEGRIVVGRIVHGGVAQSSGLLNEGDELIEVQGQDLRGATINQVCDLLRNMSGDIKFVILPKTKLNEQNVDNPKTAVSQNGVADTNEEAPIKHMRVLFDYDPEDDIYVPCKELALKLTKGDVLHVISQADVNWWQAYRDGDDPTHSLAGLVPSAAFQTQREIYQRELHSEPVTQQETSTDGASLLCAKRQKKVLRKTKLKHLGSAKTNDQARNEVPDVLTYEDVSLYLSRTGRKRPIVLVGPPNVGCLALRQKLMEYNTDQYSGVVPHTTRPKQAGEQDGVHYHFVSKVKFIEDTRHGRFVEWGEFQKNYYGTSFEAIQSVVARGCTCVMTLKAESLRPLRASSVMPFVIFVAPPSLVQLKMHKNNADVKEEDLKQMLQAAQADEQEYGQYFDRVLVNLSLEDTFNELKMILHQVDTEPQWVPTTWVTNNDSLIQQSKNKH